MFVWLSSRGRTRRSSPHIVVKWVSGSVCFHFPACMILYPCVRLPASMYIYIYAYAHFFFSLSPILLSLTYVMPALWDFADFSRRRRSRWGTVRDGTAQNWALQSSAVLGSSIGIIVRLKQTKTKKVDWHPSRVTVSFLGRKQGNCEPSVNKHCRRDSCICVRDARKVSCEGY